jgi:curved DNA-binding protein CbpA
VTPDHYAVLGLTPTSQDVVIRAAYVALARLYHPDVNPSAEAAAHTRAINEAYAVLGDPERRAEYDKQRMEAAWVPDRPIKRRSPSALFAAAAISVLALVAFLFVREPLPSRDQPFGIPYGAGDEMAGLEPAPPTSVLDPQSGLRQAPGQNRAANELQLPLPPPMARFASKPAPAPPPAPVADAAPPAARRSAPAPAPKTTPVPVATPVVSQPVNYPPKPSFSCRFARTRGEIAVCRNSTLAGLDRQQAILYSQSWGRADGEKRTKLLRTHQKFVSRRDGCRSDKCTSAVYLARLKEVNSIMMDR